MKVLVVEDNFLVADTIRLQLELSGHIVLGPAARIAEALALVDTLRPDCALLDVNLGADGFVSPLAEQLAERAVPFGFLTGYPVFYDPRAPLGTFRDRPILTKPYKQQALIALIETMKRDAGRRCHGP
jgi:CheY-like chemotaxis protein